MHADAPDQVDTIVKAILEHLEANPRAADSAEGVARWWLGPAHLAASVNQVECALDRLVVRGAMRRSQLIDGTFLYSQVPVTRQ